MIKFLSRLWQRWGVKASFSIFDQAVLSSANFVFNILLVRWLGVENYGVFAIVFAIFLFLSGFYQAIVLEPMSVLGSAYYRKRLPSYLGAIFWIHWGITFLIAFALFSAGILLKRSGNIFTEPVLGLAVSIPFILLFWLFRRVCYLKTLPEKALKASVVYAIILLLSLGYIQYRGFLSPFSALLAIAVSSLGPVILLWKTMNVGISEIFNKDTVPLVFKVLTENLKYGKWVAGSAFVSWLGVIVYVPLIGIFVGVKEAGVFRAMQNLVLPLQRTVTALGLLLLPWLSEKRALKGTSYLKGNIKKLIKLNIPFSFTYVAILLLFGKFLVKFLYGESYYDDFIWLLPYLGAIAIIESVAHALYTGLKALERPDANFFSQATGGVFTLTAGIYLVVKFKLEGAAIGSFLSVILITTMLILFLRSHHSHREHKSYHMH